MKALVTGASGFVGGAVVRRARQLGWTVLGLGRRQLADDPDYRSIDLCQPFVLDFHPDVVIHAAARSSPWGRRAEFEKQNVAATQHVLDFCATHARPHLIYISTAAVLYRNEHQLGMTEQTPVPAQPINDYARTKRLGELLVQAYSGTSCVLRPRAVFGPGDTVLFPRLRRALERGRVPRIQSDRPVVGDLVFIDTLADFIVRAADRRSTGLCHLTNNEPVEIYSFLEKICAQLSLPTPHRGISAAKSMRAARAVEAIYRLLPYFGEPPVTQFGVSVLTYSKTFDVTRALHDLGPPSVTLADGLSQFIVWQRAQPRSP